MEFLKGKQKCKLLASQAFATALLEIKYFKQTSVLKSYCQNNYILEKFTPFVALPIWHSWLALVAIMYLLNGKN